MSDSHGSVSGGSTRVPVFDHKDNARTKQDRWHYFVRQSLAYVESSMVTHCKFDGSKPEFWDFSWILQDKAVQWEMPSFPRRRKMTKRDGSALSAEKRRENLAYNGAIWSLHARSQALLYGLLRDNFGRYHSSIFQVDDLFSKQEQLGVLMQAGATYADAAESVGIPDSTTASFPSQGTAAYRALLKIYVDEAASGVLSVLLDLVKLENSFTNSWSAYRNNMMTGYYNATQLMKGKTFEEVQVLKCLIGIITSTTSVPWRTWAEQYISSKADVPGAMTMAGFSAAGDEFEKSLLNTTKAAKLKTAQPASAHYVGVGRGGRGRGRGHHQHRGGSGGRGGRGGGLTVTFKATGRGQQICSSCGVRYPQSGYRGDNPLCKDCLANNLHQLVGSQHGAQRLQNRQDHKTRAHFARQRGGGGRSGRGRGRGGGNQQQQQHGQQQQQQQQQSLYYGPAGFAANVQNPQQNPQLLLPAPPQQQVIQPQANMSILRHSHHSPGRAPFNPFSFGGGNLQSSQGANRVTFANGNLTFADPGERAFGLMARVTIVPDSIQAHLTSVALEELNETLGLPRELHQVPPEHFGIGDTGASHHIVYMRQFIAYHEPSSAQVTWGNGDTSRAVGSGHLFALTLCFNFGERTMQNVACSPLLITSGFHDTLLVTEACRHLISLTRLAVEQGHDIRLNRDHPVIILNGSDVAIPLIYHEPFFFVPMYLPSQFHNLVPHEGPDFPPLPPSTSPPSIPVVNLNSSVSSFGSLYPQLHGHAFEMHADDFALSENIFLDELAQLDSLGAATSSMGESAEVEIDFMGEPEEAGMDFQEAGTDFVGEDLEFHGDFENFDPSVHFHPQGNRLEVYIDDEQHITTDLRRALIEAHKRFGHIDPRVLITGKRSGRFYSSAIPARGRVSWSAKDCPICLAMRKKKAPLPLARAAAEVRQDATHWAPWEKVFCDSSGKFRIRSRQGNNYYAIFKCSKLRKRAYYAFPSRAHFLLVFLKHCTRYGWPKYFFSDQGGEMIKKYLKGTLLANGTHVETVPRGEHHLIGSIEVEIGNLDAIVRATMADVNVPSDLWDIVGEYLLMVDDCIRPVPENEALSRHEAYTGEIPNLNLLPPVGCFAIRNLDKIDRNDFKLSPQNECGIFIGMAHLQDTYGSVILVEKSLVVARDNVRFIEEYKPWIATTPHHQDWVHLHRLLQYGPATADDTAPLAMDMPLHDSENAAAIDPLDAPLPVDVADVISQLPAQATMPVALPEMPPDPQFSIAQTRTRRNANNGSAALQSLPVTASLPAASSSTQKRKASFTLPELHANKLLLLNRSITRYFPELKRNYRATIVSFNPADDTYHLRYADGYFEDLSFVDILRLIPKSWWRIDAESNVALILENLYKARLNAIILTAAVSVPQFTLPNSHKAAMAAPDRDYWIAACDKEYYGLDAKGVWQIVDISTVPNNTRIIGCRWVLDLKYKDGKYERHKGRIVALGYLQEQNVDFLSAFSPTASHPGLKLVQALFSIPGFWSLDFDALQAFVSATLPENEQVYMRAVPGYDIGPNKVLKLIKGLYGLRASARYFYLLSEEVYTQKCGLTLLQSDQCIFVRFEHNVLGATGPINNESILQSGVFHQFYEVPPHQRVYQSCIFPIAALIICLYVDNNAVKTNCAELVHNWKNAVDADGRITLNLEGHLNWFLGVRYKYDFTTGAIEADQEAYIDTLLHRHGMTDCRSPSLPWPAKFDLYALPLPVNPDPQIITVFASLVGELLYVMINTAPELSVYVSQLTRFMTKAGPDHLQAAKQVLKYLKGNKTRVLRWCARPTSIPHAPYTIARFVLFGYCDASWADDRLNRKSSTFYALFINGGAFTWRPKLSSIQATSTAEAEMYALAGALPDVIWARQLLAELGFAQYAATPLFEDNEACIKMCHKELSRSRNKHVHLKYCFVNQLYVNGVYDVIAVSSDAQVADVGCAPRSLPVFQRHRASLRGEQK